MRVSLCLAVLGLAAASYAHPTAEATHAEEWKHFKIAHNKNYESPVEDSFRMKIFIENKIKISVHNELFAQGKTSYTMKMNHFGDMLPHEIIGNGLLPEIRHGKTAKHAPSVKTPSSRDWRDEGVVTPVKDQGGCGSCWAFSTVGTVEGAHAQHSGKLVSLSEQQLVDCDNNNYGCGGGWMTVALDYVVKKGLESERSYPYQAVQLRCKYDESQVAADDITSYVEIATGDEDGLEDAVGNQRPVSVAVNANNNWFYYDSGVFDDSSCNKYGLNHGVLAVGYGYDRTARKDYWIVKNSWNANWGEDGYIRLVRGKNMCGIAQNAAYATFSKRG